MREGNSWNESSFHDCFVALDSAQARNSSSERVGRLGLEPRTHGLKVRCSTIELTPRGAGVPTATDEAYRVEAPDPPAAWAAVIRTTHKTRRTLRCALPPGEIL